MPWLKQASNEADSGMKIIIEYLPEILRAAGKNDLSFTALGVVIVGLLAWRFERTGRMAVLLLGLGAILVLVSSAQVFETVRQDRKQRAEESQRVLDAAEKERERKAEAAQQAAAAAEKQREREAAQLAEARKPVRWTSGLLSTARVKGDNDTAQKCWPPPEGRHFDKSTVKVLNEAKRGWFGGQGDNRYNHGGSIPSVNEKGEACLYLEALPTLRNVEAQTSAELEANTLLNEEHQ